MDQEWTTGGESTVLNMPKVAEGAGFEPADRLHGRWFSRPSDSNETQLLTAQGSVVTGLFSRLKYRLSIPSVISHCLLVDQEWTTGCKTSQTLLH